MNYSFNLFSKHSDEALFNQRSKFVFTNVCFFLSNFTIIHPAYHHLYSNSEFELKFKRHLEFLFVSQQELSNYRQILKWAKQYPKM